MSNYDGLGGHIPLKGNFMCTFLWLIEGSFFHLWKLFVACAIGWYLAQFWKSLASSTWGHNYLIVSDAEGSFMDDVATVRG